MNLGNLFQRSQSLFRLGIGNIRGLRNSVYREERIVANEDGSMIICWHPEPKFPYECTQPVPRNVQTEQT